MRRELLFMFLLVLLPATGAAQTDKKPAPEHVAGAAKAQVKKEALSGQKEEAPAKAKAPQDTKAETQAETKKALGQTEAAPVKTEAGQTEEPEAQTDKDPQLTSVPGGKALGMSVLGNQEAPTSLVIVPWKSSEVGRATGISPMLDDSRQPVDKEVFMRELRYYEIRSEKKP
jgi:hypothetical protein